MALRRGVSDTLRQVLTGHFHPVILTEADWPTGIERLHTGRGDMVWNGLTWMGVGSLVQFRGPEEAGGVATSEATVKVAATLATMFSMRGLVIRNRPVRMWFGATTTAGGNILATGPMPHFAGYFDSRSMTFSADGEDRLHDMTLGLGVGPGARSGASVTHSYEDQIARYSGDTAGRQVQIAIRQGLNPRPWPAA